MLHACQKISYHRITMAGKAAHSGAVICCSWQLHCVATLLSCSRECSGRKSFWSNTCRLWTRLKCGFTIRNTLFYCYYTSSCPFLKDLLTEGVGSLFPRKGKRKKKYPIVIGSQSTICKWQVTPLHHIFQWQFNFFSCCCHPLRKMQLSELGPRWNIICTFPTEKALPQQRLFFSYLKKNYLGIYFTTEWWIQKSKMQLSQRNKPLLLRCKNGFAPLLKNTPASLMQEARFSLYASMGLGRDRETRKRNGNEMWS